MKFKTTARVVALCISLSAAQLDAASARAVRQWSEAILAPRGDAIPLAVLGDSDSHAYHDELSFPPGGAKRGGVFRAGTFQWTEVLALLRGSHVDLGPWGSWGSGRYLSALKARLGFEGRSPRKQDFRNSFAISGAGCEALTMGSARQVDSLRRLMDERPEAWRRGIVVIRIGVNTFGMDDSLDALASDPLAPVAQATMKQCLERIRETVRLIHERHPTTRVVLVGIFDNSHWPNYFAKWQSAAALARISAGLDHFDRTLERWAAGDPRLAFFDDRAWFAARWGGRDGAGRPAYRSVRLASGFEVRNLAGDSLAHSALADGHAGTAWNALWAQSLVALLDERFGAGIPRITDGEVAGFVHTGGMPSEEGR